MGEIKMTDSKNTSGICAVQLPGYRIEVLGYRFGMRVTLYGAIGLWELDESHVRLFTKNSSILITGERLSVTVFEGSALEIEGKISELSFGILKRGGGKR